MSGFNKQRVTSLGITNKTWGVCGFTSSFYAMYDHNPAVRPEVINATSGFRVLAEIKTYLMLLKAENSRLLKDITDFTRSFGGEFRTFDIDAYIQNVNNAVELSRSQILADPKFSIALPPVAVADYIGRIWGWKATISEFRSRDGGGDGIIGVTDGGKGPYNGLRHYMYRSGGSIYSWGKEFNSVQAAADWGARGVRWRVCYVISMQRP